MYKMSSLASYSFQIFWSEKYGGDVVVQVGMWWFRWGCGGSVGGCGGTVGDVVAQLGMLGLSWGCGAQLVMWWLSRGCGGSVGDVVAQLAKATK
jgi:hypothetical protein